MNGPEGNNADVTPEGRNNPGLLEKLMARVRPEFRADIMRFDPADPVFGGPPCRVRECSRPARCRDLCLGHYSRWRQYGCPDLEEFVATADPRFAREVLLACQVPGCRYGRNGRGLCGRHLSRWRRTGRPDLAQWLASQPAVETEDTPDTCPVPGCVLWLQPRWPFCRSHGRAWIYHGRPAVADYLSRFDEPDTYASGLPDYEHIDLRELPAQLKLEMQYALQCRRDDEKIKTLFGTVRSVVRFLLDNQLTSFLDWPEHTWRQRLAPTNGNKNVQLALALYAHRALQDLLHGRGWEAEYPRGVWRLRNLGIEGPRATISFDKISQPWLKDVTKRWTRWRLSTGLGPQQASYGATTLARFSTFLAEVGVDAVAQIDRALLERYLADLHNEYAGRGTHTRHIGQLGAFFDAIRRHGWDTNLPATAAIHAEDYPKQGQRPPRALSEHVMAQLEDPANLNRWDNPDLRLITLILMRCGLRISSALTLGYDCVVRDADRAPYLRYVNTKMKREALVPIDDTIVELIGHQQQRVLKRWPGGTPILFPRPRTNLRGDRIMDSQYYREGLSRWLKRCEVRDELGRPVHVKPHQWRHTLGTRLINRDVPQEVVRKILDHDSSEMTSHYANPRELHQTKEKPQVARSA